MRLLHTTSYTLEEFDPGREPPYAILSHTWEDSEIVYTDIIRGINLKRDSRAEKILRCCRQACNDKLDYVWIDTCCINKSSSAELQEAINSMFAWYKSAKICYAYLSDFVWRGAYSQSKLEYVSFENCRWFTRGWTLQELIAPSVVIFYDQNWNRLGSKQFHVHVLEAWTGIPGDALLGESLGRYSITKRLSWAMQRQTRRPEDRAYSLLGIFDVSMPMIYGEGERKAFRRLMREISEATANEFPMAHFQNQLDAPAIRPSEPSPNVNAFSGSQGEGNRETSVR